jgi:benzoylsuccinyl-CoA thiolase BbsA subunit
MADRVNKDKQENIAFFHPDLLEIPETGLPYLKGYRCKQCGKIWFPKFAHCPNPDCWSDEMEVIPLSRRGRIYSATDVFIGQPSMRQYMPLSVGYVDLPEGIRIFAQLEGGLGRFRCEDEVELTTGPVRNNAKGEVITSYKFKKIEQGERRR